MSTNFYNTSKQYDSKYFKNTSINTLTKNKSMPYLLNNSINRYRTSVNKVKHDFKIKNLNTSKYTNIINSKNSFNNCFIKQNIIGNITSSFSNNDKSIDFNKYNIRKFQSNDINTLEESYEVVNNIKNKKKVFYNNLNIVNRIKINRLNNNAYK